MAGLYLHIPFCKQACHYCNFHFSTSLHQKEAMVEALIKEIILQKDYLEGEALTSIYLGGGTPSLLSEKELRQIFEKIYQIHKVDKDAEITLEANPDDLTKEKLITLRDSPVNRLSIGIQSFSNTDLQFMNRAHNAQQAKNCIINAQQMGFSNLTIDLIYGTPTTSLDQWRQNIETLINFQIPHISAYCLTVEPNTALHHFVKTGKAQPVNEQQSIQQFEILLNQLRLNGYEHYEISNFAKPNAHARHNSNYWLGVSYLGVGPSAHSFNGVSRQWNIAHNTQYIRAIQQENSYFEKEILTIDQQYNEYILTALRTKWGCDLEKIKKWGEGHARHFEEKVKEYILQGLMEENQSIFTLTDKGKLLADRVAMELFVE